MEELPGELSPMVGQRVLSCTLEDLQNSVVPFLPPLHSGNQFSLDAQDQSSQQVP